MVNQYYYNEGTENVSWIEGYSEGIGSQSKNSDHFYLMVSDTDAQRTYVTENKIDLTNINTLYIDWESPTSENIWDYCFFGITDSQMSDRTTWVKNISRRNGDDEAPFSRTTDSLDVSGYSGSYYIKIQVRAGGSLDLELKSYQVYGEEVVVVTTNEAANIQSDSAQLNGTLESLEGNSEMDVYFEWGTDTNYGNTTSVQTLSSTGDFNDTISGLIVDTTYHYRAVVTDGTNTWYGSDVTFTTSYIPDDYNKLKRLNVREITGTPTIERTVPIKIVGGDDSTTGTGDIVLDWTNISSKADIAVYDENDNLFDYYFESFDATNEKAVIHVYDSFVRDGTEQVKVAYGDGPSDQSVVASTVFGKKSNLKAKYLYNQTSGDLVDVSGNSNNGTLNGGISRGVTGIVDGAYEFNAATDEYIEVPYDSSLDGYGNALTLEMWHYTGAQYDNWFLNKGNSCYQLVTSDNNNSKEWRIVLGDGSSWFNTEYTGVNAAENSWELVHLVFDGNGTKLYINGSEVYSDSISGSIGSSSNPLYVGNEGSDGSKNSVDGKQDATAILNEVFSPEDCQAFYDATKSSPDFFSQQAAEETKIKVNTFFPVPF
jgi:hypothetical protein